MWINSELFGTSNALYVMQMIFVLSYHQALIHSISFRESIRRLTTLWFRLRFYLRVFGLSLIVALSSRDFRFYFPIIVGLRLVHMYVARFPPKHNNQPHLPDNESNALKEKLIGTTFEREVNVIDNSILDRHEISVPAQLNELQEPNLESPESNLPPIRFSFQDNNNNSSAVLEQRNSSQQKDQVQFISDVIPLEEEVSIYQKQNLELPMAYDQKIKLPSKQSKQYFETNAIPFSLLPFKMERTFKQTIPNGTVITTTGRDKRKLIDEDHDMETIVKKRSVFGRPVLKRKNGLLSRFNGSIDSQGEDFVEQVTKRSRVETSLVKKADEPIPPAGKATPVSITSTTVTAPPSFAFPTASSDISSSAALPSAPPFSFGLAEPSANAALPNPTVSPIVNSTSPTPLQQPLSSSDDVSSPKTSDRGNILKSSIPGRPPPSPTSTAMAADKGVAKPFEESSFGIAFNSKKMAAAWPLHDSQPTENISAPQPTFTPGATPAFSFAFPAQPIGTFSDSNVDSTLSVNPFSSAFSGGGKAATSGSSGSSAGAAKRGPRKKVSFR